MTCEKIWELINLELDDQLTEEEVEQLNSHRASCSQCSTLSQQLQTMHNVLSEIGQEDAPAGFTEGVMEKIHQEKDKKKVIAFRKKMMRYGSLAAAVALCFGLYQVEMNPMSDKMSPALERNKASVEEPFAVHSVSLPDEASNELEMPEVFGATYEAEVGGWNLTLEDLELLDEDVIYIQAILDQQAADPFHMVKFNSSDFEIEKAGITWSTAPSGLYYAIINTHIWDGIVPSPQDSEPIDSGESYLILLTK